MKKNVVFLLFSILIGSSYAQKELILEGNQADVKISGASLIRIKAQSNIPAYIRFYEGKEILPENIELFFQEMILPSRHHHLQQIGQEIDQLGHTHIRYQQYVDGYPVEGSMYSTHLQSRRIYALHGDLFDKLPTNIVPTISDSQAFENALSFIDAEVYKWELKNNSGLKELDYIYEKPEGELVFAPKDGDFQKSDFRLAYKFDIYAHKPLSRSSVYVDAQTGEIIWKLERLHAEDVEGTAETKYSGVQTIITDRIEQGYRLREAGRGKGIWTLNLREEEQPNFTVDFLDEDNYWNNVNENHDEVATDAHFGAEKTYDYFLEIFERNSIDGNGARLASLVHYGEDYVNAFWDGNFAAFGDGNSGRAFTTLDIVAHEFTHGLTGFTANLIYQNESGALNESFSDIFGVAIERYTKPQAWNWLIGEELGRPLRSMADPNLLEHPKNYQGALWLNNPNFDNGGVHINSGVQNHWFYLLVEGGSGTNDFGNNYQIDALGFEKAAAIAFRNLTIYLTPSSQYADARFYANIAAAELFGVCTPEVEATTNAWYAVGVGDPYEPKVISGFDAKPLENCDTPFPVSFFNQSQNASNFLWDFGDGQTSTEVNPIHVYEDSGSFNVKLTIFGGECGTDSAEVEELVNISSNSPCLFSKKISTRSNCQGILVDEGGESGNYTDQTDYVVTIAPPGAYKVNLQFRKFSYEENFDYLIIYDGPDINSPIIGEYTGSQLPNNGNIIRSSGNAVTIRQTSDFDQTKEGFELSWFCSLPVLPEASFSTLDTTNCNGYVRFKDDSFQAEEWSWNFGDGNESTEQNPIHYYEDPGNYTVTLTTSNDLGISTTERRDYINISSIAAPIVQDITLCETTNVTLSASTIEDGILNWYNQSGELIQANANSLSVIVIPEETTYFVEQEIRGPRSRVGPPSGEFGPGSFNNNVSAQYLIFDTYQEITIDSVWVSADGGGVRNVKLWDNTGRLLDERSINITARRQQVALNFTVPKGIGYRIGGTRMRLFRNNSGPEYPYADENGLMKITGSSGGESYYYYFYNWIIRGASCVSEKVPIKVARSSEAVPMASFDFDIDGKTVTFSDRSSEVEKWFWDFGNNDTSSTQNPTYTYQEDGEYIVRLIVYNEAGGCTDTTSQIIKVGVPTNVPDELENAMIKLYPNPGNGIFEVLFENEKPSNLQISVFNMLGKQVFKGEPERNTVKIKKQISLEKFAEGTYLIQIRIGGRVVFRKYILR